MSTLFRCVIVAMAAVWGLSAQQPAAAVKESLAKNQAALKQYTWTETTQISVKGEVKKTTQKQCRYGPDGKVQKTAIGNDSNPQQEQAGGSGRRGRHGGVIKQKVVQNKVEDMKDYMEQVAGLVHLYVPPDPAKIQESAAVERDAEGQPNALVVRNYAKPNDQVTLAFDATAKKIRNYNVTSYLDKPDDAVDLAVSFDSLADGTNYAKEVLVNARSKHIQVRVTNSGHQKVGS